MSVQLASDYRLEAGCFSPIVHGAVGGGEGSLSAPEVSLGFCVRGFLCLYHSGGLTQAPGWYIVFFFHRVSHAYPSLGRAREFSTRPQFVPGWNNVVAASSFRILLFPSGRSVGRGDSGSSSQGVVEPAPPSPGFYSCVNEGVWRVEAYHHPLHLVLFCGCVRVSDSLASRGWSSCDSLLFANAFSDCPCFIFMSGDFKRFALTFYGRLGLWSRSFLLGSLT